MAARLPGTYVAKNLEDSVRVVLRLLDCMRPLYPDSSAVIDIDGTILHQDPSGKFWKSPWIINLCKAFTLCDIPIFAVTARADTPENRRWTERQLSRCGIQYEELFMRDKEDDDYGKQKLVARDHIRKSRNRYVLVTIGDRTTDHSNDGRLDALLDPHEIIVGYIGDVPHQLCLKLPEEHA
jgi:hypothetical protein